VPGIDPGEDLAKLIMDTFAPITLTFTVPTSTGGVQGQEATSKKWYGSPDCRAFAYFVDPIEHDADKVVPAIAKAIQQRYPEATGAFVLNYKTDESKEMPQVAAPGAASNEAP